MNLRLTNVLLIEDNPGDRRLIKDFLSGSGDEHYIIKQADTLRIGLKLLNENEIDIILIDLSLPDSEGLGTE
jgi:DNA-binding NarL/FixJ family response regulator